MEDLKQVCEEIYKQHGYEGGGRFYFEKYIKVVENQDNVGLMLEQFREFNSKYNLEMLLSLPELWKDLDKSHWMDIMEQLSPRPETRLLDDTGFYDDLKFLHRYIKVNPFEVFANQAKISTKDKRNALKYCKVHSIFFIMNDWDKDNFNEGYYKNVKEHLEYKRQSFLQQGQFTNAFGKIEDLRDYLEELSSNLEPL